MFADASAEYYEFLLPCAKYVLPRPLGCIDATYLQTFSNQIAERSWRTAVSDSQIQTDIVTRRKVMGIMMARYYCVNSDDSEAAYLTALAPGTATASLARWTI